MAEKRSGWGKWILVIVVLVAVIAGGIWYHNRNNDNAPQYQTVPVERGDLTETVTATAPRPESTATARTAAERFTLFMAFSSLSACFQVLVKTLGSAVFVP